MPRPSRRRLRRGGVGLVAACLAALVTALVGPLHPALGADRAPAPAATSRAVAATASGAPAGPVRHATDDRAASARRSPERTAPSGALAVLGTGPALALLLLLGVVALPLARRLRRAPGVAAAARAPPLLLAR